MAIHTLVMDVNPDAFPYRDDSDDVNDNFLKAYNDLVERNDHSARNWLNRNVIGIEVVPGN